METMESFEARVVAATGVALADIPEVSEENALRTIFCKRGDVYIVGMDNYPSQDEDGYWIFTTFGKVILK